jgi:hypothetical protein
MWQMVHVILLSRMAAGLAGVEPSSIPAKPADSHLRSIMGTICHTYTFYLLMMGC